MNDDRVTYHQLRHLTGSRDRPAARAIDNAARGVNATERTIRQLTGMIRAPRSTRSSGGSTAG